MFFDVPCSVDVEAGFRLPRREGLPLESDSETAQIPWEDRAFVVVRDDASYGLAWWSKALKSDVLLAA